MAELGFGQSEPVAETALRRVVDYRCRRGDTYCTRRIYAGHRSAPTGGWCQSCAERRRERLARLAGWGTDVTDRVPRTSPELEVRRIYEPNRLAAMNVSAAYALVVPHRGRPARRTLASASASVSRVVAVRPEMADSGARRAG